MNYFPKFIHRLIVLLIFIFIVALISLMISNNIEHTLLQLPIYQTNLQTLNRNTQMSDSSYGKTMINIDFEYCRASAIAIAKKWEFNEFNENKAIAICAKENNHRLDILILWQIQTATYKYVSR